MDKIGFSVIDDMEVKRVYLKTEHGYTFNVKLYNGDTYTHFECKTWQALCKAYAFEPDMVITFDIRPKDDIEVIETSGSMCKRLQFYHYVSFSQPCMHMFMSLIQFIQK